MKTLAFDDLNFQLRESDQRRTLEVIVDRDGTLVLAAPPGVPPEILEQFIEKNLVWVYAKLAEKEAQARPSSPREYVAGEGFLYLGRSYRLRVVPGTNHQSPLRLYHGRFELRKDAVTEGREHFIRWYTLHLRPVLDRHIDALVNRVGAEPPDVRVQELGYHWGSSNGRGDVYFHWRVALLPQRMIEYLVTHELAHLIERGHTSDFWGRVERVVPDYIERQRWLRNHGGMYDL